MSGGQWAGPPPQRNRAPLIVGGVLAAAVVLLVVIFAAASGGGGDDDTSTGGDGGSAGPRTAVEKFLKARQDGETALDAYLCRDDVSNGFDLPKLYHGDFLPNLMIVSYTIKSVEKDGDRTYVNASVRTSDDTHEVDGKVPVAREGGAWKVCFSRGIGETTTDVTSSSSTPSTTGPPPTVSGEACDTTGQSDPSIVADHYAVPNGGSADRAQACVYQGSVPVSVTKQVVVQYLIYDHGVGGGPFVYKDEKDGSTVTVTVTRESDGKFWVTDVSMS